MGFGHPGGQFSIGPSSMQANANAGLPFAEVPGDLAGRVEAVLEHEPDTAFFRRHKHIWAASIKVSPVQHYLPIIRFEQSCKTVQ